jgi:hypothetical protein
MLGFLSLMAFSLSSGATPFTFESNGLPPETTILDLDDPFLFESGAEITMLVSSVDPTRDAAVDDSFRFKLPEKRGFALATLGLAGLGLGGSRKEVGTRR